MISCKRKWYFSMFSKCVVWINYLDSTGPYFIFLRNLVTSNKFKCPEYGKNSPITLWLKFLFLKFILYAIHNLWYLGAYTLVVYGRHDDQKQSNNTKQKNEKNFGREDNMFGCGWQCLKTDLVALKGTF